MFGSRWKYTYMFGIMNIYRVVVQVQDSGEFDTEGGSIPDNKRRADAGWEPEAEPGFICDNMDGTRVR